jgi:FAD/FMN-containing dehydrogenase
MTGFTRRQLMQGGALVALNAALPDVADAAPRIVLNDASQLSPTPVFTHWISRNGEQAKVIERLRQELKSAAAAGRPVAVSAARHSMGGQSLPRDGTAITLDSLRVEPNTKEKTYLVDGGVRWQQVIAALDKIHFSPAVMQSNNDFGIGATFSVNAHGWPVPYGPFGSTVRSLRLMLADGTIVTCSRTENDELFKLAMGGYGLVGIILDLEVDMVPNVALQPTYEVMPAKTFATRFIDAVRNAPPTLMAYGRLNVSRNELFDEALLVTYRPTDTPVETLPPAGAGGGMFSFLSREVYRAQTGSESIKRTRWFFETVVQPMSGSGIATRNTLINEPVSNLRSRDTGRTDILHEYFVPPARFGDFIDACKDIIPTSVPEFLNVTLRYVGPDKGSVLSFAPEERIAAVMSFSQKFTPEAEAEMIRMTESLIDRVTAIGGTFYLPYRLHARRDQVAAAYPNVARFVERKRHYDPRLLFRNAMWQGYFANECAPQTCG